MNGDFLPLKEAYAAYLGRWYAGIYPDTPAVAEFASRGLPRSIVWAPDRMVDKAEDMLKSYQKNSNQVGTNPVQEGKNAIFPVVIVAMSKDYMPASADMGGRQIGRRLVQLVEGGSVYGYRQAMGEIRTQVVVMAPESATARSLASQFSLWLGEIPNRRFSVTHKWGQYTLTMPCMIELPDIIFSAIETESSSMTVLAADVTLKTVTPYLDAPREGDPNDGSDNNPPGYPTVAEVQSFDDVTGAHSVVTADETVWNP
jgi:hypothetical protein